MLASAKPGAHLINVGCGSAVDHAALVDALDQGSIGYATLDVTDPEPLPAGSPFYANTRVPHLSSNYRVTLPRLHRLLRDNVTRFLAGDPLLGKAHRELGY